MATSQGSGGAQAWRCKYCSYELAGLKIAPKFCPSCGESQVEDTGKLPSCDNCGSKVPSADMKLCPSCISARASTKPIQETSQTAIERAKAIANVSGEGASTPPAPQQPESQPPGQPMPPGFRPPEHPVLPNPQQSFQQLSPDLLYMFSMWQQQQQQQQYGGFSSPPFFQENPQLKTQPAYGQNWWQGAPYRPQGQQRPQSSLPPPLQPTPAGQLQTQSQPPPGHQQTQPPTVPASLSETQPNSMPTDQQQPLPSQPQAGWESFECSGPSHSTGHQQTQETKTQQKVSGQSNHQAPRQPPLRKAHDTERDQAKQLSNTGKGQSAGQLQSANQHPLAEIASHTTKIGAGGTLKQGKPPPTGKPQTIKGRGQGVQHSRVMGGTVLFRSVVH